MVMRLLLEPLPASWPELTPPRPTGLRGLLARLQEVADAVRQPGGLDDFEGRMRRAATQAIVREAYHQTVGEQEDEQRRPAAFAKAWKSHLAALLAQDTVKVSGRGTIAAAGRDTELAWKLYDAASRARADAIAHATATPSTFEFSCPPTSWYAFAIAAGDDHPMLGRVRYAICEPCGAGLLRKIDFSSDWRFCGLGTRALRELEARHPALTWYTTGQYESAQSFYERYRTDSSSPWTANQCPCPHFGGT
ncbi:hypothetical protein IMZ11_11115 [Microtetraspora sp. AC03309]|uniref:hypothetical protein n=1 Tax=Microtetraspora sp. AC03309 TaxID=2779376 RepID=UPI001E427A6B|nr:hypothetical protein [Microtetraspora sp. AC03309]MCC5576183.1 hypothetical protein [Microtetraspora sp. AC03309]